MPLSVKYFGQCCFLFTVFLFRQTAFCQLNADFSTDKPGGCSPLAIHFTNLTTGASPNAVCSWDFGNGNSSSLPAPAAIYTNEQTYSITLTVQDGSQTSSRTKEITVYKNPAVDFNFSTTKGCLPLTVSFTANAAGGDGNICGYTWDFGDGSTIQTNTAVQTHIYNVPQTVSSSLTVTNQYGCHTTIEKKDIITVIPSLTAGFTADKKVLCLPSDPVQFTNTSNGPGTLSYLWDFGDGNSSTMPNPNYAFNKKGIYSVKLTVKSSEGCTAVMQQSDYLNVANYNTDFTGPETICQNNYASFSSVSTPAPDNIIWEVDDVQIFSYNNLSYWFANPGVHTVKLDNGFGACKQSVTKNITVKTNPVITGFDAVGQSGCGNTADYQFSDHTAGAVQWQWDFDHRYDPPQIGSTAQSPAHTYYAAGNFNVWLRVTNAGGCSSIFNQLVQIPLKYAAIMTTGNVSLNSCAEPITQTFSANTNQDITDYNWTFSDGQSSTEASPTHTFTDIGRYTVTLNYKTREGCTGTITNTNYITIYPRLKLDFSANPLSVCGDSYVFFTALPNDPNVISWHWEYGDGSGSYAVGSTAFHNYGEAGIYTIKLYAAGPACDTVITKENYITVQDLKTRITDVSNSCEGDRGEVTFTQTSEHATSLNWDFGDGITLKTGPGQLTVRHIYKKSGSYPVQMTAANDECSQTAQTTAYVLLKQNPVLSASPAEVCINEPVTISITGLGANPTPFPYSYPYNIQKLAYPDGTPFDGSRSDNWYYPGTQYTGSIYGFNRAEEKLQAIVISSYFNCLDSSNFITVKIKGAGATAAFEQAGDNLCYSTAVEFKDASKITAGLPIQSWLWDFGDGQTAGSNQGGSILHTYKSPGIYYASLKISDAGGCSSTTPSYAHAVSVVGPLAAFTASGAIVPLNSNIYFYNNSNSYGSPGTVYSWDFGDQSPLSNEFSPSHTYPVAGTYTVTLTATNPSTACSSSSSQVIVIKNFNTAFGFTTSYIAGSCPPVLVYFKNTSINYSRVTWDFGDGITADNLNYPSHVYEKPGKYIVVLHVYAPNGLSKDYIDSVFVKSPEASVTVNPLEVCIGSTVSLFARAINTSNYLWDYGDGNIAATTEGSSAHQYLSPGSFQAKLMMQNEDGCYGKADPGTPVVVRPNPVVTLSPENPLICRDSPIYLHASGGTEYVWTPATGLSNDKIADPVASPKLTSDYNIEVTDDLGCKNSRSLTVEVVQAASIQVNGDTAICAGEPVPLKATGEEIYQWIGTTDGLSDTEIPNPEAKPPESMIYTVTGSDKHNCFTDTASVHIRVMPLPVVSAGADAEIWSGESVSLNASGSNDVTQWNWQPEKYLSCYDCPDPVCTAPAETNYILTAKNQDGCLSRDTVFIKIDCAASHVFIPNIFTPNRDGVNDVFKISGIAIIRHMVIYGRWGEKVFERNNFNAGDRASCWDGNFKGMESPSGSYVYFIEMECPTGGIFTRKGSVILIR